jgi:hypothetical protein
VITEEKAPKNKTEIIITDVDKKKSKDGARPNQNLMF